MLDVIFRRFLVMITMLLMVSVVSFFIIELPPGDYLDAYVSNVLASGGEVTPELEAAMRASYGLDDPTYVRYLRWMNRLSHGDMGRSMELQQTVLTLIAQRLPYSVAISLFSLCLIYLISFPVGLYIAAKQYSIADYTVSVVAFVGVGIPPFLFALACLWIIYVATGKAALGLFSPEFQFAPWSLPKVLDLGKHLLLPAFITAFTSTAATIRILRANLLDELEKPYVMVARAKGMPEWRMLIKYPLRFAINPIVSTIGWVLPALFGGELLTSMVLGLPTIAPMFVKAIIYQDMYLAAGIVLILSCLTIVGTFLSDVLLVLLDPRIRA